MKHLLSRVFSIFLAGGALVLLAFGPRPQSNAPAGRVRIEYWEKWTGLEAQQMKEIVDDFNNTVGAQKGIWVDYNSMSQIDRKTLVSTAAGAPPDVVGVWDRQVLELASIGGLEPLDRYAQQAGLTRDRYKTVYYDACKYKGTLYAIPNTVWCVALLWNKQIFEDKAAQIRAAGLDPNRPPRTIAELDRYAAAIDTWETRNGRRHLAVAGFVPLEPISFIQEYDYWFGGQLIDPTGTKAQIDTPQMHAAYDWIRSYSERIGKDALADFRSVFNSGGTNLFDTPQNPVLVGWIAMEQHGPWMAAFIEKLAPSFNRWHVPPDQLQREKDFDKIQIGMSEDDLTKLLGPGEIATPAGADPSVTVFHWPAGIKNIDVTFTDGKVTAKQAKLLPAKERQKYCQWGAAPFPTAVPGLNNVTYAGMDVWIIPSTAKHKKEAFEFIAFASRQKEIEKLCSEHCNLSPLKEESQDYLENHPNPYIDVYEALAASPNAYPLPRYVNWDQVFDELTQTAERSYMLDGTTSAILAESQERIQSELNKALNVPEDTNMKTSSVSDSDPPR